MWGYPDFLKRLIEELSGMPTIGPKSAERMALYLLKAPKQRALSLAEAISAAREQCRRCRECNFFADAEQCLICGKKESREKVICVVEDPQDVMAIEQTGRYRGLYHVLWGRLSPLEGTGPDDLPIKHLVARIKAENISEVIIATSSSRDGETTALYLKQILSPLGIRITRIARGIPVGSALSYIDRATISEALQGRG